MMKTDHSVSIEELTWSQVRSDVSLVLPQLAAVIDSLCPSKKYPLYKVKYPFGSQIAHKSNLYLPTQDGKISQLELGVASNSDSKILYHGKPPAALMLKNSAEMYYEMPDRIISGFLWTPGKFLWLWEHFENTDTAFVKWAWSLVAGAKTFYMLPKITDAHEHKELQKKFGIKNHAPKGPSDHWAIFKEIASSQACDEEWHCEILLFPHIWFETARNDSAWKDFYHYLFEISWNDSSYWRHRNAFELIWESFVYEVMDRNIKPNLYLACIVKQLILTGTGILPGLSIAEDSLCAPIKTLKYAYTEIYRMRKYYPIFMQPNLFTFQDKFPTYYSLQQPNLLETIPVPRNLPSVLSAIPDIYRLLNEFRERIAEKWIAKNTPIDIFCKNVICDFFHYQKENWNEIRSTNELAKEDRRFNDKLSIKSNRTFPNSGSLINGCVRFKNSKKSSNNATTKAKS